jgi:hypothetical protein
MVNMDQSSFYAAVRGRLAELWADRNDGPIPEFSDTDSFVERGLIDSWSIVQLVAYVQEQTGVQLDLARSDPLKLLTLTGLAESALQGSAV